MEAEPARRPYHRHHRRNPRRTLPLPPAAAAVRTEPTIIDLIIQILSLEGSTGLKVIKPYSWVVVYLKVQKVSLYGRGLILLQLYPLPPRCLVVLSLTNSLFIHKLSLEGSTRLPLANTSLGIRTERILLNNITWACTDIRKSKKASYF